MARSPPKAIAQPIAARMPQPMTCAIRSSVFRVMVCLCRCRGALLGRSYIEGVDIIAARPPLRILWVLGPRGEAGGGHTPDHRHTRQAEHGRGEAHRHTLLDCLFCTLALSPPTVHGGFRRPRPRALTPPDACLDRNPERTDPAILWGVPPGCVFLSPGDSGADHYLWERAHVGYDEIPDP